MINRIKLPERIPPELYQVLYRECGGFVETSANSQVIWEEFKKYFMQRLKENDS